MNRDVQRQCQKILEDAASSIHMLLGLKVELHARAIVCDSKGYTPILNSIDEVMRQVTYLTGITEERMKTRNRSREVAEARKLAAIIIHHTHPETTFHKISARLNNRPDHATAKYYIKKAEDLLDSDKKFNERYNIIIKRVNEYEKSNNKPAAVQG